MVLIPKSRVLVVDDNRVNRMVLSRKLNDEGYDTIALPTGQEALQALGLAGESTSEAPPHSPEFDVVLLDIMMPTMDGMEVLRTLRQSRSAIDLPVIMVTAKDRSDDVVHALEAEANDYVTKPIDFAVLVSRMRTHLDLRELHANLRSAQRSLIHAAKLESVAYLAAGVAHEIRNPLAQIEMSAEAIRQGTPNPELQPLLETLSRSVQMVNGIVQNLLTFTDSQRLSIELGQVAPLLAEVVDLLRPEIESAGIELQLQEEEPDLEAQFAPEELKQVLLQVLLNSIQAMPEHGTLTLRLRGETVSDIPRNEGTRSGAHLRSGDPAVCVEVLDTGPGIPETDLGRIFDPFFTRKPTGRGTGLGLTIARNLMELQGGMIQISNRTDRENGARVRLWLKTKSQLGIL